MELLTAVNRILPALGEHPVTSLNQKHPTLAILLPGIDGKRDDLTMQGWWFNSFDTTLYPDPEKYVAVPAECLSFVPKREQAVVRGKKLFNAVTLSYAWNAPVEGNLITRVPFNELPESVAGWVFYSALVDAYVTDIGVQSELKNWERLAGQAEARVLSEHLRNKKYTTRKSPRYQRIISAMRA